MEWTTTGQAEFLRTKIWGQTTAIGSLPHTHIDTALAFSFQHGIPFFPQTPIRTPWEFMIPQALSGIPGLQVDKEGETYLDVETWQSQSHLLKQDLEVFFSKSNAPSNTSSNVFGLYEKFEPSGSSASCWEPFLWELQERNQKVAKIQIAGPITAQWGLQLRDSDHRPVKRSLDQYPEISSQIFKWVLARSLTMVRRLLALQIRPIIFLDEPAFFALSLDQPKHLVSLQELKLLIQSLKKEGAIVGVHCCSNTDWNAVFTLGMDLVSLDTSLSLKNALAPPNLPVLENFLETGGRFSLGIIPTGRSIPLQSLSPQRVCEDLVSTVTQAWPLAESSPWVRVVLKESLLTPACGLALQSIADSENILERLLQAQEILSHLELRNSL